MSDDTKKIIEEYSEEYCQFLEAAYGSNMMSEGGEPAIDRMFLQENLKNKTLLDIGFGLGGVDFYLAEKHHCNVFGVEINPWMVEEATHRIPSHLKSQVSFLQYHPEGDLPFSDNHFDIVFSKGVLTHLKDKTNLFKEVRRVLKPGGAFIIDDWLSPQACHWGEGIKRMCEKEKLTLYAETESNYINILEKSGLIGIEMRDENKNYYQYNRDILNRLTESNSENTFTNKNLLAEFIEGYQLISDSIKEDELLIRWFKAKKRE